MITNQLPEDGTNNYAIANYGPADEAFTVRLDTKCTDVRPMDVHQASIELQNTNDCIFVVHVKNQEADLFYFQADVETPVDFFKVSIV